MNRDKKIIEKLPDELKSNSFWRESHIKRPTTFGSEARTFREVIEDDPYKIEKELHTWKHVDEHRSNHARLQITTTWGHLKVTAPSSAKYDPDHEKLSKRESFPSITIATKPQDTEYYETMKYMKTLRAMSPSNSNNKDTTTKLRKQQTRPKSSKLKTGGEFKNINVDDMRKSLLPGPGTYELDMDNELKFSKSPRAVLPRRNPVGHARPRLNFESLELVTHDNVMYKGSYYSEKDPTLKSSLKFSLGARRPLLGQREFPTAGPGDYDDFSYYRVGGPSLTSSVSTLKPRKTSPLIIGKNEGRPVQSFPRRNMISGKPL